MKTFILSWSDRINCSMQIKAKDEQEAEKIFKSGSWDWSYVEEDCRDFNEDLIIHELY